LSPTDLKEKYTNYLTTKQNFLCQVDQFLDHSDSDGLFTAQYEAIKKTPYDYSTEATKAAIDFAFYYKLSPSEILLKFNQVSDKAQSRYEHFVFLRKLYFKPPLKDRLLSWITTHLFPKQ
jgi:hypothetical protein